MELIFQEGDFLVKTLDSSWEVDAALRLRHDVFVDELRWVPPVSSGLEIDAYDSFAHPIGIFDNNNRLVGHVRLICSPNPFMIEKEFACLLPKDGVFIKTPSLAESTRICVSREVRNNQVMSMTLGHLLYKAIYHWCKLNKIARLVTIVEKRYYVLLKRSKFPFEAVGDFSLLGEGILSGIIVLDWGRVEDELSKIRPDFFNWLTAVNVPQYARSFNVDKAVA
ncbi:GNAT family N-acetyltransferase [bacterium]|nr:MAG: GNAT family N-acetyltransferase [bacterium]